MFTGDTEVEHWLKMGQESRSWLGVDQKFIDETRMG